MGSITKVGIRWQIRRDMAEVLDIENDSFDVPWREEDFLTCLRQRNCIGMVAELDVRGKYRVVGYMLYELHRKRFELLNFAVRPEYRRQSVGRQLIAKLQGKLDLQRRNEIVLAVRETNLAAQLFFQKCGFVATGISPRHFDYDEEDAYLMNFRKEWSESDEVRLHG